MEQGFILHGQKLEDANSRRTVYFPGVNEAG
jgi:hypothetical protein